MHPFPLPIYLFSVSGFLIFFIGFYSWRKVKTRESLILFFLATAQFSWAILNFLMLNSCGDNIMVEFWDRLVYIPVIFFAPLLYHFSIEFCKIRTKWQKILLYISYFLAFIFIILSRTDYFVKGVFNYKWGCHTIAQTAHHFWLLFTTIFIMLTFFNILKKIKDKSTPPLLKEQSFYVFLALFFYSLNISAAFPAYKIGIYPIGYLGLPLFTFILAYAITEKNLFPQVLATDILIAAILIFLFTLLIFPEVEFNFSSRLVFFILVSLLCILLLRSVHQEAKRRIEIENMAIRERKLRQDAEKLNEEFKRLDDAKTQFLLATQHHLRTPLTVMRGYLDLIFEGSYGKVPKELKEALDKFQLSVFRLIKIVNELLDVSQFQLGKEIVYLQDNVDLKEILDEVYEELKYEAIQKDIYFNIELPKDNLPKIKANPEKLKVALFNLTDNAIKYTNKGGVCIKVDVLDNKVLICIKDTGIGIEKERLPNLFNQIFERGRDAKKSYALGRGIGLFVSSKIIEGHKGKIWAESEGKGKGSTFYVELPIG